MESLSNKVIDDSNNFRPYQFITRAESVAVVLRYTSLEYVDNLSEFPFQDVSDDHWARFYIELSLNHDLILFEDNFYPKRPLTRAEMVAIFSRTPEMIELVNEKLYSQ